VVAVAVLARAGQRSTSPWARPGQWHWELEGLLRVEPPLPRKGALGLFALDPVEVAYLHGKAEQVLEAARGEVAEHQGSLESRRLSTRVWSKGSARGAGPQQQSQSLWVGRGRAVPCSDCGKVLLKYGPGPARHGGYLLPSAAKGAQIAAAWPRCAHGELFWVDCLRRPAPPPCCAGEPA
jgi:hypothetical protein